MRHTIPTLRVAIEAVATAASHAAASSAAFVAASSASLVAASSTPLAGARWVSLAAAAALLAVPSSLSAQDTLVVRADNEPAWGRDLLLVEEVRIGVLEGDPAYAFGYVSDVAQGEDGRIWVADSRNVEIRVFDDLGRAREVLGRSGEGPGEFGDLSALEVFPDESMVAWDPRLQRVSIFNKDGSFLRSFRVPINAVVGGPRSFVALKNGSVYVLVLGKPPGEEGNYPAWLHATLDGVVLDTLRGVPRQPEGPPGYAVQNLQSPSPDGYLVTARSDRWAVHRPLMDGRVLRIERDVPAVGFAWAERREAQAREDFFATERRGTTPQRIPRNKPLLKALDVDQEGRIWVQRYAEAIRVPVTEGEKALIEEARRMFGGDPPPPQEYRERMVFDVVDADGRYLGEVRFPYWNSRLVAAKGKRLWVIQTGEYGEHYVVQYGIEERGRED